MLPLNRAISTNSADFIPRAHLPQDKLTVVPSWDQSRAAFAGGKGKRLQLFLSPETLAKQGSRKYNSR
jgi:hypothetical protein